MKMMVIMENTKLKRKPKLPRKRKKACIKAQGRSSYYSTINLAKIEGDNDCKFWVNSTVSMQPVQVNGRIIMIPLPTKYW